jgi:hypothetical protein
MCDYSLHAIPNRLAREGERLITHRFLTGSIGLASPLDLEKANQEAVAAGRTWWTRVKSWLNPPALRPDRIPAVCIPPGARLRMQGIPRNLQHELGVYSTEEVVFVELSASEFRYRDGVRFANGQEILLQYLDEGLLVDVISLDSTEATPQPAEELGKHPVRVF